MSIALDSVGRALAVFAHPDDLETAAGGVVARLAAQGAEVHAVIVARGDKGANEVVADPEALVAVRRAEALDAAAMLGIAGTTFFDYPDGGIDARDQALQAALVSLIREVAPAVVIAPDPTAVFFGDAYVNHRDHREIGWAVLDAVAPAAANPNYFPEQVRAGLSPHAVASLLLSGTLDPNVTVDISAVIERKIDAVFCHRSQLGNVDDAFRAFLRERAADAGRAAGMDAAETFRHVALVR